MSRPNSIIKTMQHALDIFYGAYPQPAPSLAAIEQAKVIAHRGAHNLDTCIENTCPAFDRALAAGCYGIECDVRWTQDLVPVIFHDPDCRRVFQSPLIISEVTFETLHQRHPEIPTLEAVVHRYGKKTHLILELKDAHFSAPNTQRKILQNILSPLAPIEDFHLISLSPRPFEIFKDYDTHTYLFASGLNIQHLSAVCVKKNYGGIHGHFALMTPHYISRHRDLMQSVGAGLLRSVNSLKRELSRQIDWLYTDYPEQMLAALAHFKSTAT